MTPLFPGPVLAALQAAGDRPAFEVGSRTISRGELHAMVHRIASALTAEGLGPGTGVGMLLGLSPEAYAAHLAAHALGCRVAAGRPGWSAPQRADALDGRVDVVLADGTTDAATGTPVLRLDDLLDRAPHPGPIPALARPDDVARLTYTSGSTGRPKACAHTYRAMSLAYRPDRWAPVLTRLLTHFGRCLIHQNLAGPVMFTYLGRCLVTGGTVVIAEDIPLPEAIDRYGITATMMPPARLDQMLRGEAGLRAARASGGAMGTLRAVLLGGSPASPGLLRAATGRLGPIVWQGYGQAEAGVIAMLTPADIAAGHEASVGHPMPAVEVAIRDGEVCVRSPHMMAGYWNDPEQTREVLRDGWLHTRDLGHLDAGGRLHLTGRARDVIMVNAEVCYAGAIERVLATHPRVAQAYVVGAPDPRTGEAIHAFVVPAGDTGDRPPDEDDLRRLVRQALSANSVPASVTVIREVPMNPSGKPDKKALLHRTGGAGSP